MLGNLASLTIFPLRIGELQDCHAVVFLAPLADWHVAHLGGEGLASLPRRGTDGTHGPCGWYIYSFSLSLSPRVQGCHVFLGTRARARARHTKGKTRGRGRGRGFTGMATLAD